MSTRLYRLLWFGGEEDVTLVSIGDGTLSRGRFVGL